MPDYQVACLDVWTGDTIDILTMDRIERLTYTRSINANPLADCVITVKTNDRIAQLFQKDMIVEVYRRNEFALAVELEGTYLARRFNPSEDDKSKYSVIKGQALERLLKARKIKIKDDSAAANGISRKDGFGDAVMTAFVTDHCISPADNLNRVIPNFTTAPTDNLGYYHVANKEDGDNLLEVLQEIANKSRVDFRIIRNGGNALLFQTGNFGTDRTKDTNYPGGKFILFTPGRGNIWNPNLELDYTNEITAVTVLGDGPEDSRRSRLVLDNQRLAESPFSWVEETIDANENENDDDALFGVGWSRLKENERESTAFSFTVDWNAPDLAYNIDWGLGDRVSAEWFNFAQNMRITGIQLDVGAGASEKIGVTLTKYEQ